eukprot:1390503-Heterocapsa_arctica.AAC.1
MRCERRRDSERGLGLKERAHALRIRDGVVSDKVRVSGGHNAKPFSAPNLIAPIEDRVNHHFVLHRNTITAITDCLLN